MPVVKMKKNVLTIQKIFVFVFLSALFLPLLLMPEHLTYDEYWSLYNFTPLGVGDVLTDLSLPNNHPLNTLFMKLFTDGEVAVSAVLLRSLSLICGALIPCFCGMLAYKWSSENRETAFLCASLLAFFSVPLVVYSGLARGYALQLFFILLCLWAMSRAKEHPWQSAFFTAVGGIGCFLSVSSGALFLPSLAIGYLVYSAPAERKSPAMWCAAGVTALCGITFYWINRDALATGQTWGMSIDSVPAFGKFLLVSGVALAAVPALAATLPAWIFQKKRLWAAGLLFLPFVLSIFTNGGPARCYLYLPAAIAVSGGIGLAEVGIRFKGRETRYPVLAAVILGAAGFFIQLNDWRVADHVAEFNESMAELPSGVLPVYRASAGYPIVCGSDQDKIKRLIFISSWHAFDQVAVFDCKDGIFNGLDEKFSEAEIDTGRSGRLVKYGGLSCRQYDLYQTEKLEKAESYIIHIRSTAEITELLDKYGDMLYLNAWLTADAKIAVFKCAESVPSGVLPDDVVIFRIGR